MHPPKREAARRATGRPISKTTSSSPANNSKRGGAQAAQLIADVRFRHRIEHLERLGNRITGELLAKLAVEHDCRGEIERFIDRCVEREEVIRKLGFDKWPPLPLRAVPR